MNRPGEGTGRPGHLSRGGAGNSVIRLWSRAAARSVGRPYLSPRTLGNGVVVATNPSTRSAGCAIRRARAEGIASNMPDYDRARAEFSWAAARARLAGLPGGRPQHRLRGGRSPRGWPAGGRRRFAFPEQAPRDVGAHLCGAEAADRSVRERARGAGGRARRARVRARRPDSRAVRGGARHAQARQRVLSAVLGVRAGADRAAPAPRQTHGCS